MKVIVYNDFIMNGKLILLIERTGNNHLSFATSLERKEYKLRVAETGKEAMNALEDGNFSLVILNGASINTSGLRIIQKIRAKYEKMPLIHIFPEGTDEPSTRKSPANVKMVMPFTARKLINRISRLIPDENNHIIRVGPIHYSPTTRVVQAYGREKRLTPKAGQLLEVFMKNPGKTMNRSELMKLVWKTDYIGDTRTLDVHIRWVREAIEANSRKPQHLMTVRGSGYRFNANPEENPEKRKTAGTLAMVAQD